MARLHNFHGALAQSPGYSDRQMMHLKCIESDKNSHKSKCKHVCLIRLCLLCLKVSPKAISRLLQWERSESSSKQLVQLKTVAFPCRWLIQVQCGGRGGIRLWAVSVNHTVLPHRKHLSPNTKGSSPWGTLKPISSLTCNPSSSIKSSIVERYHIHFLCTERIFRRKSKRQRKGAFLRAFRTK